MGKARAPSPGEFPKTIDLKRPTAAEETGQAREGTFALQLSLISLTERGLLPNKGTDILTLEGKPHR